MTRNRASLRTVLITGVGALGQEIAARVPPDVSLILVDFDRTQGHNLPVSPLLSASDLDLPKVSALAARLQPGRSAPVIAVPHPIQHLRCGPFRVASLAIAAFDNRLADAVWSQLCRATGVPVMVNAKLAGGDSLAGRLRYYHRDAQICEQCWWTNDEHALVARLARSCTRSLPTGPSITSTRGSRLLADALSTRILAPVLAGLPPALRPGCELRILDDDHALVLSARPKFDCPGRHDPVPVAAALAGDIFSYRVGDLIAALDAAAGPGWRWHLPAEMMASPLARGHGMALTATHLAPLADHLLASLWPAGDLVRVQRSTGELLWIGLPLEQMEAWLQFWPPSQGDPL